MTNQGINSAVARNLGYEVVDWKGSLRIKDEYGIIYIPQYSTDIAAAWEVVEHLRKRWILSLDSSPLGWYFGIRPEEDDPHNVVFDAANTAPMAICKAFLKLKEE